MSFFYENYAPLAGPQKNPKKSPLSLIDARLDPKKSPLLLIDARLGPKKSPLLLIDARLDPKKSSLLPLGAVLLAVLGDKGQGVGFGGADLQQQLGAFV